MSEQTGEGNNAPSEHLSRESCGQGVNGPCGINDSHNEVCGEISQKVAYDVCHNHACCGEFDGEFLSQADQKNHGHREDGQKKLILNACQSAGYSHNCMEQGKYVNYECYITTFHVEVQICH